MTIAEMFGQSGVLTLLGMAVVFAFLIVLIICVTLVGKLVAAMGWDSDVKSPKPAYVPGARASDDAAVVAAIGAAVNEHRKNNA